MEDIHMERDGPLSLPLGTLHQINESSGIPMSIDYSEIMWLGAIILVLTGAALTGLWKHQNSDAAEPIVPLLLSPAERELLNQQKTSVSQKTANTKKAAKKALKVSRRGQLNNRRTTDSEDPIT